MKETRAFLKKLGLPEGDNYDLSTSEKRFNDGGQYRFEVPGIQGPNVMEALLDEIEAYDLVIHRVTQTKGVMMLTDEEIKSMVNLASEAQVELVLAIGPRATNDTSATVQTKQGKRMGLRLRGQEQIVRAVEEVKRGVANGVHSFLLYDEGLLWLLNKMKDEEEIPQEVRFKVSAHCGHGNPCSINLLESIGAGTVNPVRDMQLPMLSAIREAIDIPIDLHTENPASSGGFIRHYEVPEMIRVAAPLYLKTGGSVAKTHSWDTSASDARQRAKQVSLVQRVIDTYYPEAVRSEKGSID